MYKLRNLLVLLSVSLLMACPIPNAPIPPGGGDAPSDTITDPTAPPTDTVETISKFNVHVGYEVVFVQILGTDPDFPFLYTVTTLLNGEKVRSRKSSYNKALTQDVQDKAALWEIEEHRLTSAGTVTYYDNYYVVMVNEIGVDYFYDIFKGGVSGGSRIKAHQRIQSQDGQTIKDLSDIVIAPFIRVDNSKIKYAPDAYPCCFVEYYDYNGDDLKYIFVLYQNNKVKGSIQKLKKDIFDEASGETFKEGADAFALQYIIDKLSDI